MHTELYNKVEAQVQAGIDAGITKEAASTPWREVKPRTIDEALDQLFEDMGMSSPTSDRKPDMSVGKRNPEIEAFLAKVAADVRIHPRGACYVSRSDTVTIPEITQFYDPAMYYRVMFHELAHWTGHPSRTGRLDVTEEGAIRLCAEDENDARSYLAQEEMVAEMCCAYLSEHFGLPTSKRHPGYYGWFAGMHADRAAAEAYAKGKAKEAFEYLINRAGLEKAA